MSKKPKDLSPREALEKLKVASGGEGNAVLAYGGLIISLSEGARDFGFPYAISVLFGTRRTSIGLSEKDVVTKGKSNWRRDNCWRLSPDTVARFEPQIADLVARLVKKENETK